MVALPAGILASAFSDNLRRRREAYRKHLEEALKDGRISSRERRKLEAMGTHLGIDHEDAESMLSEATGAWECPSCGYSEGST